MISWTATRVDKANYCGMRYYLSYVEKVPSLRLPVYVKGSLLHNMIEKFWIKHGTEEEVAKKSSKKKYSNAEEFSKYAQGLWMRTVIGSEKSGNPLPWSYDSEKWVIHSDLKGICTQLYPLMIEEGPPILSEIPFKFIVGTREFSGRIDYVRLRDGKVVIGDYKSGSPFIGEMRIKNDPQLTLYNKGLCALCLADDRLAEKLNLTNEREKFRGDPFYINPDFVQEYFMIEAPHRNIQDDRGGNPIPVRNPSGRTREHFLEVMKRIDSIESMVGRGEIVAERGKKCDYCDVKYACDKRLENVGAGHLEDKYGQGLLVYAIPSFARNESQKDLFPDKDSQQKFRFSWK